MVFEFGSHKVIRMLTTLRLLHLQSLPFSSDHHPESHHSVPPSPPQPHTHTCTHTHTPAHTQIHTHNLATPCCPLCLSQSLSTSRPHLITSQPVKMSAAKKKEKKVKYLPSSSQHKPDCFLWLPQDEQDCPLQLSQALLDKKSKHGA